MGILDLFERKIKGKDMTFVIKIKSPTPYPEEDIRWKKYGNLLCSIFNPYFDEIAVEYFKDNKGRLDQINMVCYKSKFEYKKSNENEFFANLFRLCSNSVGTFFDGIGIKAEIEDVYVPSDPSLQEHVVSSFKANSKNLSIDKNATKKTFKPVIIKSPETNRDDLIVGLGKKIDVSDMETEGMTIQKSEDGRYFVGFISKRDGKRYYVGVPENLGKELMSDKF